MSNEETGNMTAGGRSPRQGLRGSPVGSTISIVLAVVAVIAGFLILRNITDDGGSSDSSGNDATASIEPDVTTSPPDSGSETTTTASATTTTEPLVTEGATVMVANANGVGGSAGRMSKALGNTGFTMADAGNATVSLDDSVVQFDGSIASARAVARSVATVMGGLEVERLPTPPEVDGGDIGGAGVLVLLGENEAEKTLKKLQRQAADAAETGAAPEPSGTEAASDE